MIFEGTSPHHRILYYNLLTACKLNGYLADIDRQAEELFSRLVKQMAERVEVTETQSARPNGMGQEDAQYPQQGNGNRQQRFDL